MCQAVLTQLQDHPDAWTKTDHILEFAQSINTKFYALQVLEKAIKTRWKTLPREQREGIKTYIVNLVFKLSVDDHTLRAQKLFISKLNSTLVQVCLTRITRTPLRGLGGTATATVFANSSRCSAAA